MSVTCVSPSQVVPTPGTVYHKLVKGLDDPRGELAGADGASSPAAGQRALDRVTGRVTYSQQILKEFGWITDGRGRGVDTLGTGYSQSRRSPERRSVMDDVSVTCPASSSRTLVFFVAIASPGPNVLAVIGTAMSIGRARASRWRSASPPARSAGRC